MTIILISCVKGKKENKMKAKDLYKGPLFKYSLCVAKKLQSDETKIFILSAKHYLLDLNRVIGPYDLTLKKFSKTKKKEWGLKVLTELRNVSNIETDKFIVLAGEDYIKPISQITDLTNFLGKRNYGKRTAYLKAICNEY